MSPFQIKASVHWSRGTGERTHSPKRNVMPRVDWLSHIPVRHSNGTSTGHCRVPSPPPPSGPPLTLYRCPSRFFTPVKSLGDDINNARPEQIRVQDQLGCFSPSKHPGLLFYTWAQPEVRQPQQIQMIQKLINSMTESTKWNFFHRHCMEDTSIAPNHRVLQWDALHWLCAGYLLSEL